VGSAFIESITSFVFNVFEKDNGGFSLKSSCLLFMSKISARYYFIAVVLASRL
jgi:hypothetical protein